MKIVFFLRDISVCGGIQQTTCVLANKITALRIADVSIISLYNESENPFFELKNNENLVLFNKKVDQRRDIIKIRKRLTQILSHMNYDIFIVQGTAFSCFLTNSVWEKAKVIVCEHGHFYIGKRFGLHSLGKKIAINKASAIVTLTSMDAKNYKKHCKYNTLVRHIYNSVIALDEQIHYNQKSKIIVSCASLDDIKRIDHSVKAAKIVLEKHPDWRWMIYGDGPERGNLQRLIDLYDLTDRVLLCGYEQDKNVIFKNKALFVLTSKFEGFGLVLVEAMQYHLPLVSYSVNYGPKELIEEGSNGILVEDGKIEVLANAVEKLIINKEYRLMLANGGNISLEKFSVERILEQWIELFESIQQRI